MAYNVHNFNGLDTPINLPAYHAILRLIKVIKPDVITFEEFLLQPTKFKIADSLKKVLNANDYYFEPFVRTPFDSTGLAIFSKYPMLNRGIVNLSTEKDQNKAIFVDLQMPKIIIRVYCVHLESLNFNTGEYHDLNNYHLPKYVVLKDIAKKLKAGYVNRGKQVALLKRALVSCKYPYIIAGDFNDTPNSFAVNQLSKGLKNSFREKGEGLGSTFNTTLPILQIDYIFTSPQFDIQRFQIVKEQISDHNAIYSDVDF